MQLDWKQSFHRLPLMCHGEKSPKLWELKLENGLGSSSLIHRRYSLLSFLPSSSSLCAICTDRFRMSRSGLFVDESYRG